MVPSESTRRVSEPLSRLQSSITEGREVEVEERVLARISVDEMLVLEEISRWDQLAGKRLGIFGILVRYCPRARLVHAEERPTGGALGREGLHLHGQRPGIEQAHHGRNARRRAAALVNRSDLPAQCVV